MLKFRRILTIGAAVMAAGMMVTGVSAAAPSAAPADSGISADSADRVNRVCVQNRPYPRKTLELWKRPAPTYCLPDANNRWGWLNDQREYFYCQKNTDKKVTVGRYWNTWWALTDDDSGNVGTWVNVVYIKGGGNGQPHPDLRRC
ncbi:hypothetical protein LZG04_09755 [Saccharothrix sp. S26]|uniref:hypothetical protein n=1 Tax=Saccharothrix sp. S26 TaxID=2907215 RepID=UPI001F1A2501|nr:hypothetical protein [Saccharothrix sp. S26]MCE6995091.1 hypothetical protein [Saccharothrix sp. S26]